MARPKQHSLFQVNPPRAQWDVIAAARNLIPDEVRLVLELDYPRQPAKARKGPRIRLAAPLEYVRASGKVEQVTSIPCFTNTSKMWCPSFSMPAGPIKALRAGRPPVRGTCPASLQTVTERLIDTHSAVHQQFTEAPDYERQTRRRVTVEPPLYICDGCYAGKGLYAIPLNAIRLTLKLAWVHAALEAGVFVDQMTAAIAFMRDLPAAAQAQEGIDTRYFRIHDSGDFFAVPYYLAWRAVCEALPGIRFWAPTRQWVFPAWRDTFAQYPPPRNLALRPSALFFGAPAPAVQPLAAGSTASAEEQPVPVWNCPAYEGDDASTHNCESVQCRRCWTQPATAISYREH